MYLLALQVFERLDDAVWRHNGLVLDHEGIHSFWVHNMGFDLEVGVHYERILVKKPVVLRVWEVRKGVAHGGEFRP